MSVVTRLAASDAGEWCTYQHITSAELLSVLEAHLERVFCDQLSLF
jgi:hypothetical protein